jgi:hypothetical protein
MMLLSRSTDSRATTTPTARSPRNSPPVRRVRGSYHGYTLRQLARELHDFYVAKNVRSTTPELRTRVLSGTGDVSSRCDRGGRGDVDFVPMTNRRTDRRDTRLIYPRESESSSPAAVRQTRNDYFLAFELQSFPGSPTRSRASIRSRRKDGSASTLTWSRNDLALLL